MSRLSRTTTAVVLLLAALPTLVGADEVPFNALRFGSEFTTPTNWPGMCAALAANPGAFDEVWFSTGVSFPPLAWHEERARQCAAAAADLRKLGIVPSIEFQTIIGHTDGILAAGDCRGQTWPALVRADGTQTKHLSCLRAAKLREYFVRVAELHAVWKPGSVWIDDDVTYKNRCFCESCVAAFAAQENHPEWTRKTMVEALGKDKALAARFVDFQVSGMSDLLEAIAAALHRLSPETVFGYQYGGSGKPGIPLGLYKASGHPVRLRPGAGAYWDTDPRQQIQKAYELQGLSVQFGFPEWLGARCPEIESCPRTFASRTPKGVILEGFENLALGMDFLSMFVADTRGGESIEYYQRQLFPRIAAAHDFLKSYRDVNVGTLPCGFTVGGVPPLMVSCRGVPIVTGRCRSLGALPDVSKIPVRRAGSDWVSVEGGADARTMQIVSSVALKEYYQTCDRASGGKLPVLFEEAVRAFVIPRVAPDGALKTVALVNASIDWQEPVAVRLRGVPGQTAKATWHALDSAPVELPLEREGAECRVILPRLGAWDCAYLTF